MTKKTGKVCCITISLFIVFSCVYFKIADQQLYETSNEDALVLLHEIEYLTTDGPNNSASKQISMLQNKLKESQKQIAKQQLYPWFIGYICMAVLYLGCVFAYLYKKILRPFHSMEKYAQHIAKGNFDIPLIYERTDFFGSFTWAFDHMRKEIQYARKNEAKAIEDNKTIIATLSHDIKTPIASIRAYAEALEANLDNTYERRQRYLQVIMKKCDEVSNLSNDLMLHSQSELDKLEIQMEYVNIKQCLLDILHDLAYPNVVVLHPLLEARLMLDIKRLAQVIENLIENARKYALDTQIDIWTTYHEHQYDIHIKDHGKGIPSENMPFIFDKFYRGNNVGKQSGSGLGLYIVKYIVSHMYGEIEMLNHANGLEVILHFQIK